MFLHNETNPEFHSQSELSASPRKPHEEQFAEFSHELTEDEHEASGRVIVRVVPLLYGLMVGVLLDNLAVGLTMGMLIAAALDIMMGHKSLVLPMAKNLLVAGCPVIAGGARLVASLINGVGLNAPAWLRNKRCGAA